LAGWRWRGGEEGSGGCGDGGGGDGGRATALSGWRRRGGVGGAATRAKVGGGSGAWLVLGSGRHVGSRCALAAQGEGGGGGADASAHVAACFARVAWLALVGIGGVLGVVRGRGNRRQCWSVGGGASALGLRWGVGGCASGGLLQVGVGVGALAGRCCWGGGVVTALAPAYWCRRGRDPTINMRWKVEGGMGEGRA
jgi:hypothetical protein